MPKKCLKIKGPTVDIDNRFNKIIPSFSPLNRKFLPGNRLIDIFPNTFSFHSLNKKSKNIIKSHLHNLENVSLQSLSDLHTAIVISDTSVKNSVAISIAHIHIHDSLVIKTIYHAVNITSTEVEIFTLWCSINQATQQFDINYIIVITDFIHAVKRILILCLTHIKLVQLLFLVNLGSFSNTTTTIILNFGIVLVVAIGVSMLLLIKKQSSSTLLQSSLANCLGISVRMNVTTFQTIGKCFSKHQTLKNNTFTILLTMISSLLNYQQLKVGSGSSSLAIQICFVLGLQEQ